MRDQRLRPDSRYTQPVYSYLLFPSFYMALEPKRGRKHAPARLNLPVDKHLGSSTSLPPHLLGPLSALSIELSSVAQRHFDVFISGSTPPKALSPRQVSQPPSPPSNRPPLELAQSTDAVIASSNALHVVNPCGEQCLYVNTIVRKERLVDAPSGIR
jgi:hypothetical protein